MLFPLHFTNSFPSEVIEHFAYFHEMFNNFWNGGLLSDILKLMVVLLVFVPTYILAANGGRLNRYASSTIVLMTSAAYIYMTAGLLCMSGSVEHPLAWAYCILCLTLNTLYIMAEMIGIEGKTIKIISIVLPSLALAATYCGAVYFLEPHNLTSWLAYAYFVVIIILTASSCRSAISDCLRYAESESGNLPDKVVNYIQTAITLILTIGAAGFFLYHLATQMMAQVSLKEMAGPLITVTACSFLLASIIRLSLPLLKFMSGIWLQIMTMLLYLIIMICSCIYFCHHHEGFSLLTGVIVSIAMSWWGAHLITTHIHRFRCEECRCSRRKNIEIIKISDETGPFTGYGEQDSIETQKPSGHIPPNQYATHIMKCRNCGNLWSVSMKQPKRRNIRNNK